MLKENIIFIALTIFSAQDIKKKKIDSLPIYIFLAIGILYLLLAEQIRFLNLFERACLGLLMFGMSWITGEALGYGDGWIFLITGIYLGVRKNFQLFLTSMFIACIFSSVQIISRRKNLKDEIPFVPFIWIAYVIHIGGMYYEKIV